MKESTIPTLFVKGTNSLQNPGDPILIPPRLPRGMASKAPRWLKDGDTIAIEIDGIGQLTNPVTNES